MYKSFIAHISSKTERFTSN